MPASVCELRWGLLDTLSSGETKGCERLKLNPQPVLMEQDVWFSVSVCPLQGPICAFSSALSPLPDSLTPALPQLTFLSHIGSLAVTVLSGKSFILLYPVRSTGPWSGGDKGVGQGSCFSPFLR